MEKALSYNAVSGPFRVKPCPPSSLVSACQHHHRTPPNRFATGVSCVSKCQPVSRNARRFGVSLGYPVQKWGYRVLLSDLKCRKAVPAEKPFKLSDGKGLFLLVKPNGSKLWQMRYTFAGKESILSFGPYPEVKLQEARDRRDTARRQLRDGLNPGLERKRAAAYNPDQTFEAFAMRWYEMNAPRWSAIHKDRTLRALKRDVLPQLGKIPITSIDPPLVLAALRKIEKRGAIETAKRIRQHISMIFVLAISEGMATSDPAAIVTRALAPLPKKGRQPAVTDLDELRRLILACEASTASPVTMLASRLLALTVVRPGVVIGAKWTEFDVDEMVWRVPSERMKLTTDKKGDDEFDLIVPLAQEAVDVLEAIRPLTGRLEHLFPSHRYAKAPMSSNAIGYLYNRVGWHGRHVPHGWRAAFSTIMNERAKAAGIAGDREVIDLMLGHIPSGLSGSEGAYNRALYMPRRREIADEWAGLLDLPPASTIMKGTGYG